MNAVPLAATGPCARSSAQGRGWTLRKNCSLAPRQVFLFYLSLTALSFAFALVFSARGAWLIWPFALLENALLAGALLHYARHALDRECIYLQDRELRIDVIRADKVVQHRFHADWVRLDWRGWRKDTLWLCQGGQDVAVATFLPPAARRRFAKQLRAALRAG